MSKTRYTIIACVLLLLTSCSTAKKSSESTSASTVNDIAVLTDPATILTQNEILLSCEGIEQKVAEDNLTWIHLSRDITKCLGRKGFMGDSNANTQLANIIKISGKQGDFSMLVTWLDTELFRGPKVFEAILSLADDHTPTYTHDGELSSYTVSMGIMMYCYPMIDNIEGLDISTWVDRNARQSDEDKMTMATEEPTKTLMSKLYYKMILQAWQEGKIKLKPFGQE